MENFEICRGPFFTEKNIPACYLSQSLPTELKIVESYVVCTRVALSAISVLKAAGNLRARFVRCQWYRYSRRGGAFSKRFERIPPNLYF